MMDGVLKSVFAMLGIDPLEAGKMVRAVVADVQSVNARLVRIEKALNIQHTEERVSNDENNGNGISGAD